MKKITVLFLLFAAWGCSDINYDGETRLVFEGRIVDEENRPIANRDVDVAVYARPGYGLHPSDVISSTITDANGTFRMIVPAPKGIENTMSVRINKSGIGYQYKEFALVQNKDFSDYRFDLQTIVLYRNESVVRLNVMTVQEQANTFVSGIELEGMRADQTVFVNPFETDYVPYDFSFFVLRNQTVTLHYTITDYSAPDNPQQTPYAIPIAIGDSTANHTIYY
ncbi:peptidase associated/transthyretin-like domain-containing protein [Flavobacterium caeni]|uniref:Uncharacterized protein n=1 Tax=Flavobacterium caeni TaxID=490189 RepID=A0A1G5BGQ9_9FLAO|nr:hypothetical protein [Flavobacterium caeni]SCX89301.1 hypothetical protein SAMN02927903_00371 [Flavobacterium caeni]